MYCLTTVNKRKAIPRLARKCDLALQIVATIPVSSWISLGSSIISSGVLGISRSAIFFLSSYPLQTLFYSMKIPNMHKNANTANALVLNIFLMLKFLKSPTIDSTDVYGLWHWLKTTTSTFLICSLSDFLFLNGKVACNLKKKPSFILVTGFTNASIFLILI